MHEKDFVHISCQLCSRTTTLNWRATVFRELKRGEGGQTNSYFSALKTLQSISICCEGGCLVFTMWCREICRWKRMKRYRRWKYRKCFETNQETLLFQDIDKGDQKPVLNKENVIGDWLIYKRELVAIVKTKKRLFCVLKWSVPGNSSARKESPAASVSADTRNQLSEATTPNEAKRKKVEMSVSCLSWDPVNWRSGWLKMGRKISRWWAMGWDGDEEKEEEECGRGTGRKII